ncbi:hypothetical protein KGA65_17075 [Ideonella sp. B7]|uniref:hypothetical protein n=1 Tax=Ideonella benzenivorans TaxID=2831643 RepID=UPI001CEDE935|nr:hypothetical protein [Ideonella benzenivorans]MCA6218249.1 hypothetical protein [Ideonella benzenivorans]
MAIALLYVAAAMPSAAASDAGSPAERTPMAVPAVRADWRALVEPLADHPEVLTQDWSAIRSLLPVGCFRNASSSQVDCPPMAGVVRISVVPGPLGIIDIVLKQPATCDALYDILRQRFGKGQQEKGSTCYARWTLGKRVQHAYVNVSPGRKDPSLLYLQFAIEQGP